MEQCSFCGRPFVRARLFVSSSARICAACADTAAQALEAESAQPEALHDGQTLRAFPADHDLSP